MRIPLIILLAVAAAEPIGPSGDDRARAPAPAAMSCCEAGGAEGGAEVAEIVVAEPEGDESDSAPAAAAAATPAALPEGVEVRGSVALTGGWTLGRPDLSRAAVYLASDAVLDGMGHEALATVAQKGKKFVPSFCVVAKGTSIEFPNWDDFDHNVFSRSEAAPAFDLDRYPRGQSKTRVFEKLGVVQIFCNIHPQMRATVVVTPNRYFARADAEGRFVIGHVPPGTYEIVSWHERCGEQRRTIEVGAEAIEVTLTLEEDRDSIMEYDRKREEDYGVEQGLGVKRERLNLPVVKDAHPAKTEEPK